MYNVREKSEPEDRNQTSLNQLVGNEISPFGIFLVKSPRPSGTLRGQA